MGVPWVAVLFLFPAFVSAESNIQLSSTKLTKGNSEVTIHHWGATVISWKVNGKEQLFVSDAAKFDGSTHIMGGIPIVFPKFADWGPNRPFHGFARVSSWNLTKFGVGKATFELTHSEETQKWWDHKFHLYYEVTLGDKSLSTTLRVHNPSDSPSSFDFEALYHTFLLLPDVQKITISNLKGLKYNDKTRDFAEFTETRDPVTLTKFNDAVYKETPDSIKITGVVDQKTIQLIKKGFPDLVVWNPWSEVIKNFTDLRSHEWKNFVCVEAGQVSNQVTVLPGGDHEMTQTLQIV